MTTAYIGIVHQEGSSAWGICFPDLPGCFSAADDFADLPAQAAEAVALHLEGLIAEGRAEPKPSTLAQVQAHQDSKGAVSFLPISAIRRRIVTPSPYPLSDLLAQITPDNLHHEVRTEDNVGKETW